MEGLERKLCGFGPPQSTEYVALADRRDSGQVFAPYLPAGARGAFRSFSFYPPLLAAAFLLILGCARLFGWDIHAPGILSQQFSAWVQPSNQRVALYLPPELFQYESKDKGSRSADPQTYHVGEALAPMLVEGFQAGFNEFIFLETEPAPGILKQYGIPKVAVVRIKDFRNQVTWHGQKLTVTTETAVLDSGLNLLARFESTGSSESEKIFSKKGGPEVNLNAALENNVRAVVQHLQDQSL